MRKLVFTLFASTMMFSGTITTAGAETPASIHPIVAESIEQVSSSSATALSGTYVTKYNTNVRLDAGTHNKIVTLAKKGSTVTVTHQKKYGNEVWYKVSANGKSGWILSSLLSKVSTASTSATSGTYTTKYNSNVRADAGTSHKVVTMARKGSTVTVTRQAKVSGQIWSKVNFNGTSGWVLSSLLSKTTTTTAKASAASTSAVSAMSGTFVMKYNTNVRSGAGTSNKIVTLASKGTTVTATHQMKYGSQVWYKVNVNGTSGWVLSTLLTKATTQTSMSAATASKIVSTAMALRGTPYVFGGTSPVTGFDCSAFTQYAFQQNGVKLSRTTLTQFAETDAVSVPQVGDLVFFSNTYRPGISHVGIYIGNNQFVHAGGAKAEVRSMNDSYFGPKFHSFRR